MHLVKPTGRKRKWDIRMTELPGSPKIPGHRSKSVASNWLARIQELNHARVTHRAPPPHLSHWIGNLPDSTYSRLVALGMLSPRQRETAAPMFDDDSPRELDAILSADPATLPHVDAYMLAVNARRNNSPRHARTMARRVLKVCKALDYRTGTAPITAGAVLGKVRSWGVNDNTRRGYILAFRDFCQWMQRERGMLADPMGEVTLPRADADPTFKRRPLSVDEFRSLMAYLDGVESEHPQIRWTAPERKLVYWTAVCTGLRQNELRTLRRASLRLDADPPTVEIRAQEAKNSKEASIPIPSDLADALRVYAEHHHPAARLFGTMPNSRNRVIELAKADFEAVGLPTRGEMRVDFHALRATAITWWFTQYGLSVREVSELARCSPTIAERYAKHFRLTSYGWLDRAPKLGGDCGALAGARES